jgi:hypothetical protein
VNASRFIKQRRDIERRFRDTPGRITKAISKLVNEAGATVIVIEKRVIGWRLKTGEIICVKSRYATEATAGLQLKFLAETNVGTRVPIRVYRCEHCHGWHVTSQQAKH